MVWNFVQVVWSINNFIVSSACACTISQFCTHVSSVTCNSVALTVALLYEARWISEVYAISKSSIWCDFALTRLLGSVLTLVRSVEATFPLLDERPGAITWWEITVACTIQMLATERSWDTVSRSRLFSCTHCMLCRHLAPLLRCHNSTIIVFDSWFPTTKATS